MHLTINFDLLKSKVQVLLNILKNKSVSEENKKVIFKVTDKGIHLYSFSPTITAQVAMDLSEAELNGFNGEDTLFQLPVNQFDTLLSSFTTGFSKPVELTFSIVTDYEVKVSVVEEIELDGDTDTRTTSVSIRTSPVKATILNHLTTLRSLENDENFKFMDEQLLAYAQYLTADLLPYVPDKNVRAAIIAFSENYATIFSNNLLVRYKNTISRMISTGGFGYHAVSTLKDVFSNNTDIEYYVDDEVGVLVLRLSDTAMAIRYDKKPPLPADLIEKLSTDNYVGVSRQLLDAYVSRIKSMSENVVTQQVTFELNEELTEVSISTSDFNSSMAVLSHNSVETDKLTEGIKGLSFTVPLSILDASLFGKGDGYADDVIFTISSLADNLYLTFSDSSKAWQIATNTIA